MVPLFIDSFGKDGYGVIILLGTILSFSILAEFGINAGLVRYLTKCSAIDDHESFNEYFNTGLVIYIGIWIILALSLYIFSPALARLFEVPLIYFDEMVLLLRTFGIITLFSSFTIPLFGSIASSYNRYDLKNYRETIIGTLSVLTIILAVEVFNIDIIQWAIITIAFQLVTFITICTIGFKLAPHLKITPRYFRKKKLKDMLSFGLITFIGGWSRKMKINADPLILSNFFGPVVIPVYRAGVSMPSHTRPLIAALSGQIHAVSTNLFTKGEFKKFNKVFETGTKFTLLMAVPMLLIFLFYAEEILIVWLGDSLSNKDIAIAANCMRAMAFIDFCFYMEGSSYAVLYAMNKLKFMTFTDLLLGVTNIVSSILLVQYSALGIFGVLVPTMVLECLARPLYLYYTAGMMGFPKEKIFNKIYLPILLVLIANALFILLLKTLIAPDNLFYLLTNGFLLGVFWVISTWILGLNSSDKKDVVETLKLQRFVKS